MGAAPGPRAPPTACLEGRGNRRARIMSEAQPWRFHGSDSDIQRKENAVPSGTKPGSFQLLGNATSRSRHRTAPGSLQTNGRWGNFSPARKSTPPSQYTRLQRRCVFHVPYPAPPAHTPWPAPKPVRWRGCPAAAAGRVCHRNEVPGRPAVREPDLVAAGLRHRLVFGYADAVGHRDVLAP